MHPITRGARSAALVARAAEVDISNCFPARDRLLYPDSEPPPTRRYIKNAPIWRRAVASYYDIPLDKAKEVLLCALYGYHAPRNEIADPPHAPPFVDWPSEDMGAVRNKIRS